MNAIITSATKGIGLAIAELFAANNVNLIINARTAKDLEETSAAINSKCPNINIWTKPTDMSIKSDVAAFAEYCLDKFDKVDILVNNTGIFLPGAITEEADGHLEKQIETNLYSAYYLTKAIAKSMVKQQSGHIFNMCSIASKIAYPNGGSYAISKFALYGFTKVLREELKEKGIKVTAILPGATWSNSWAGVDLPKDRLMQANDIALSVWNAVQMSPSAVVEEITIRPQLGDL